MICKNCGREIPEGDAFCQNCGYPVEAGITEEKNMTEPSIPEENVQSYEPQGYTQPYNNGTQSYSGQAYDQDYTGGQAAVQQENKKKKLNPSVIGLAAVVILAVVFLKSCFFSSSYKTPIEDILKVINKKQTNIDKIADAVVPAMLSDTYDEIIDVLKSNKEYKKDFKKLYEQTLPDAAEDAYDRFYDNLEDMYGKNVKFSYKIEDKEKLDKDERKAIASVYSSFADLSSGITDCIEALENCTEFKEKELKKLVNQVEALEKKLDKFKVSSGYILDVKFTIKGKEDKETRNMDIVVIKADGDWMIDYLSTIMLNLGEYDLDELDELTDELDLKELNSRLKIMAKYLKQADKDMVEDAMENWDDIMDFAA